MENEYAQPDVGVAPPPLPPPLPIPLPLPAPVLSGKRIFGKAIQDFIVVEALLVVVGIVDFVARLIFNPHLLANFRPMQIPPALLVDLLITQELVMFSVALWRWRQYRKAGFAIPRIFDGGIAPAIGMGAGMGIALVIVGSILGYVAQRIFHLDASNPAARFLIEMKGHPVYVALLVFTIALLAPICEETFFRAVIFGFADAAGKPGIGVAASATLFTIAHLNPAMAIYYVLFTLGMCWMLRRKRSIIAPIAAHITINGTACIGLLVLQRSL